MNSGTARPRKLLRSTTKLSNRASATNNNALRGGRAAHCRRFHASMGKGAAVSNPRSVTACGPFFKVASKNSLNHAFAS